MRVRQPPKKLRAGERFRENDRELDRAARGSVWLKDARLARATTEALVTGDAAFHRYDLHAFVVMANHVHVLISPQVEVKAITKSPKGITARLANRILGKTGHSFWQDESFDHWVRSEGEFRKIVEYIEANPVSAGLVELAKDWPWSSAAPEWSDKCKRQWGSGGAQTRLSVPLKEDNWGF